MDIPQLRPPDSSKSKTPPWSFTSYSAYLTCPKRFYLTRIAKAILEPETEVLRWGKSVHRALELRVKDDTPLPDGMKQWEKYARWAASIGGQVATEQQVALDKHLTPVDYWSKDAWCRGVLDLTITGNSVAIVCDYKTGKIRSDSDQLKLFAGFTFATQPQVQTVHTAYIWLNHDKVTGERYERSQLDNIWNTFRPAIERIERSHASGDWPARPSGLCANWCPVPRSVCPHSGKL